MTPTRKPRILSRSASALLLGLSLAAPFSSHAIDLTWDIDGVAGNPIGGAGTWNTTSNFWYNGASFQAWNNAANNVAVFGGTGGTVVLGSAVSAGGLRFDTAGYTLAGANVLSLTGTPVIANADATIQAVLGGSLGFTKTGAGMLTLTGANTYTGTTNVNEGVLRLQGPAYSTTPSTFVIASGAVLNLDGNTGFAQGESFMSGAGTLRITGGAFINESPNSGGPGKNLTLNFSTDALIDVKAGAKMTNGGWANINWGGNKADLRVDGTFDLWDGQDMRVDALNGIGVITANPGSGGNQNLSIGVDNGSGTFNGVIQNGARTTTLFKEGTGIQVLGGANTYTGATTVNGGTLLVNGSLSTASPVIVASGATFGRAVGGTLTVGTLNVASGGSLQTVAGSVPSIVVANAGGLTLNGNVTLNVGGPALPVGTYTLLDYNGALGGGGTAVLGTLPARVSGNLVPNAGNTSFDLSVTASDSAKWRGNVNSEWRTGATGNWVLNSDGVTATNYLPGDTVSFTDSSLNPVVTLNTEDVAPAGVTFNATQSYTLSGTKAITGFTGLTKAGSGTLTISNTNTFSGPVTLNGGTTSVATVTDLGVAGPLGTGGTIAMGGGTLEYTGATGATNRTITLGPTGGTFKTAGSLTLSGIISGSGGLTKLGAGTVTLLGANTYTGTTAVAEGILRMTGVAFSTTPRAYTIAAGAVLNIDGNTGYAAGTASMAGAGTLRITNGAFINEAPNTPVGAGRDLVMNLTPGALIDVQAGAKMTNGGWANITWDNNKASVLANGTFDLWDGKAVTIDALSGGGLVTTGIGGGDTQSLTVGINGGSGNFSGVIQNGSRFVSFTKTGAGSQTLAGANTYTGTTTVNAGTLLVNGTLDANNTVTVAAGAAFGRTVGGTLTVGSLTLGGNNQAYAVVGATPSIVIANSGGLVLNGNVTLNIGGAAPAVGVYPIVDFNGAPGGSGGNVVLGTLPARVLANLVVNLAGTSVDLNVTGADSARWSGAQSSEWSTAVLVGAKNWVLNSNGTTPTDYLAGDTVSFRDGALNTTVTLNTENVSPGAVTFDHTVAYSLSGSKSIAGAANFIKQGTGTLTISNTNTFTGSFTANGGTVVIPSVADGGVASALGAGSTINLNNATLEITGSGSTNRGIILGAAGATIKSDGAPTFAGAISGPGGLTKLGTGTVTLLGTNTYTGLTSVNQGTLRISGAAFSTTPRNYTVASGAVLNIHGDTGYAQGDSSLSGTGTLRITGGAFINEAPNSGGPGKNLNMQLGAGALIDVQAGAKMTNGGWANINWASNLADLRVNGTFDLWDGNAVFVGGLSGSGLVSNAIGGGSNQILSVGANNGSGNFSGVIENGTRTTFLTKVGNGTQTLSGVNTYTGDTIVTAGTLALTGAGSINNTPTINLAPGAVFDVAGAGGYTLAANRTLTTGRGGTPGTDFIGNLNVAGGTLNILDGTAIGQLSLNGALSLAGGTVKVDLSTAANDRIVATGALNLSGLTSIVPQISGSLANGTYTLITAASLSGGDASNLTITTGGASRQTFTLDTTTTLGSVLLKVAGTSLSLVWVGTPATWDVNTSANWSGGQTFFNSDSVTFDDTSVNRTVALNATVAPAAVTVNTADTYTISGAGSITAGSVLKSGAGRLVLGTNNAFGGGTVVRGGTLQLDSGSAAGTGTITLGDASSTVDPITLQLAAQTYNNNVIVASGGPATKKIQTGAGLTTLTGGYTLNNTALELNVTDAGGVAQFRTSGAVGAGTISGTGTIVKTGPGSVWFGANGQTLTVALGSGSLIDVQQGTLRNEYLAGVWTNNKADLNVATGALFELWDADTTVDALTGGGTIDKGQNNTHTFTIGSDGGSGTFSGTLQNVSGVINLTKVGAGAQTFTGQVSYSGPTVINGGTLKLVNSTSFASPSVAVNNTGTFELNRSTADWTFNKPISGVGALNVTAGSGTITLASTNALTGPTSVTSGTLLLTGNLSASATTVKGFATLKGTGHVGGLLSVNDNGALSPGTTVGTLFADAGTLFSPNSLLTYDLSGTNHTTGGGINDLLSITGNLTLDGVLSVSETVPDSFLTATPGGKWTLMTYTGSLTNNGLDLAFSMPALASNYTFAIDTSVAHEVNLVVVPEPGAVLSLLGGLGILAGVRRRRAGQP